LRCFVGLYDRSFRATGPGLGLAALQVFPEGGGEARPLLVFCGCLAVHVNDSATGFNAGNAAKSRRIVSRIAALRQAWPSAGMPLACGKTSARLRANSIQIRKQSPDVR
jgi:hypothetical protein